MRSSVPCSSWIDSFSLLDIQVVSPIRDYYVSLACQVVLRTIYKEPYRFARLPGATSEPTVGSRGSSNFPQQCSGERTLRLAVLCRIVSLKVQNNFLCAVVGNRCAKGFVHLVYLGFPGRGREWWLHGDVARAVARIAVNLDLLLAIPRYEISGRHRVRRSLVVRIRR